MFDASMEINDFHPNLRSLTVPRDRRLPETLTELVLLLDRDIYRHTLADVQWPGGLRTLTVPAGTRLDGVVLPACTRVVRYR